VNRLTVLIVFVVASAACGSSATTPTPVVPPPPPALQITCPAPLSVQSSTGDAQPVRYPSPTASGGTAPVQISCTPANDSVFPIGSRTVNCTATDSKSVTAQCSFTVTLTAPPRIGVTNFVAFGDSMTWGEVPSEGSVGRIQILKQDIAASYPTVLLKMLQARYVAQAGAIRVDNSGVQGEQTAAGVIRLPNVIDGGAYQAVLFLEGVNDFPDYPKALTNMRAMIQYAKRRNERVLVATVPPENPFPKCINRGGNWAFVDPYNNGLRSVAAAEGVAIVDVNGDFHGDTTTLIDCDGLHPTPSGYAAIAQSFFNTIKAAFEIPATSNPTRMFR
jgi:lysophospholipase L1-like esterase